MKQYQIVDRIITIDEQTAANEYIDTYFRQSIEGSNKSNAVSKLINEVGKDRSYPIYSVIIEDKKGYRFECSVFYDAEKKDSDVYRIENLGHKDHLRKEDMLPSEHYHLLPTFMQATESV